MQSRSMHAFFKNFLGRHAPRPPQEAHALHSECASHTAGINPPTHRNLDFIFTPFAEVKNQAPRWP